jgi:hypothetical protein
MEGWNREPNPNRDLERSLGLRPGELRPKSVEEVNKEAEMYLKVLFIDQAYKLITGKSLVTGEEASKLEAVFSAAEMAAVYYGLGQIGEMAAASQARAAPKSARATGVDDFINNNIPKQYQSQVKGAFCSDAQITTLAEDKIVYRYYGGDSSASSYWVTPNKVADPISELALPHGNTAQYVELVVIPKGTTIIEGTVAPNFGQPGGGYQFYVPNIK